MIANFKVKVKVKVKGVQIMEAMTWVLKNSLEAFKVLKNSLEVLNVLKNSLEVLNVLQSNLESIELSLTRAPGEAKNGDLPLTRARFRELGFNCGPLLTGVVAVLELIASEMLVDILLASRTNEDNKTNLINKERGEGKRFQQGLRKRPTKQ
ncbi:hypothetical protein Tco_0716153 [Tanacetum coccineum]